MTLPRLCTPPMITIDTFPQKLTEHITVLGNGFFLLYLIQGSERTVLFEIGAAPIAASVVAQLEELGVAPHYLVVSHPHADHITALPILSSHFPNATIICAAGAPRFAVARQSAGIFAKEDEHAAWFLQNKGLAVTQPALAASLPLARVQLADNNELLDLGGVKMRFIEVKGHSPGNIIAYVEADNALLVADSLGYPYVQSKTFFPLFFTGFTNYIAAIENIAAIAPQFIGLGHSLVAKKDTAAATVATAQACAVSLKRFVLTHGGALAETTQALLDEYYKEELQLYSAESMRECCEILVRRSLEV